MPTLSMHQLHMIIFYLTYPLMTKHYVYCPQRKQIFMGPFLTPSYGEKAEVTRHKTTMLYQQCWYMLVICSVSSFPTNPSHKRAFSAAMYLVLYCIESLPTADGCVCVTVCYITLMTRHKQSEQFESAY